MQLSHTNSDSELNNDNIGKQLYFGCFSALKRNPYIIGIVLIAMAIFMYGIMGIYGFSAYPDEFGYWAPAAAMLGKDWSNITSIGSYYSYGYSVILLPVLFVFHDSIVAYRVAIVLNLFFQCVSIVIIYKILVKLFPYQNRKCLSIAGGIAVLYPAWIFYTQTTMVEGLLNFLFLTALYLAMMFFEEPGVFRGIAFSIVLIYLYFVHMRCLGIIGAGIISLLVWIISHRKKGVNFKAFLMITGILILFGISFIIKNGVVENIYKGTSEYALSWNDYSGIGYRLSKLFTFDGLIYFLKDF